MDVTKLYLGPQGGGLSAVPRQRSEDTAKPPMSPSAGENQNQVNGTDPNVSPLSPTTEVTDFDSWLVAYQAVRDVKDAIPQFENLRKVFNAENDMLDELYKPVQAHSDHVLKQDYQNRGLKLYNEWGRTKRKEFLLSYYDNEFFRAQYARNRFQNSARSFLQALALRILPQSPQVEEYMGQVSRVVSIGVGPASDVAGLLAYLRTRGLHQRLTYFVLDQCAQWEEYIRMCDRGWASRYKVSMWFKYARIGNMDSLNLLPDADMIVFSFSNTALMEPSIWPELQRRYKLIIVLDGIKEILIDSFLESKFQKFQLNEKTNLYYTFHAEEKKDADVQAVDSSHGVHQSIPTTTTSSAAVSSNSVTANVSQTTDAEP